MSIDPPPSPLDWGARKDAVARLVRSSSSEIILLSAYAKVPAIKAILEGVPSSIRVQMVVRWEKHDIMSGASDLEVFDFFSAQGWPLWRNTRLHAKLFMVDKREVVFGSANLTGRGLGIVPGGGNIECLSTPGVVGVPEIAFVNEVIRSSQRVDAEFVKELRRQKKDNAVEEWNEDAIAQVASICSGIFVNDFPFCADVEEFLSGGAGDAVAHDAERFRVDPSGADLGKLADSFGNSRIISWLTQEIEEGESFGSLTGKIHDALLDDPLPYRKDIKKLQQNLFSWIERLLPDRFRIYVRPGGHRHQIDKV